MVIGHELAHTILDHTGDTMNTMAMVTTLQLLLLTMLDPTGFLIFILEVCCLWTQSQYFS